jgi:N-acetylneuraminic acid mutarotase
VYVLGGYDGQSAVDSVLRTTDGRTLTPVATLPTAVRYTAVAAVDDRVYAFGGELGTGADSNEIQEFDPTSGRTRVAGRLPQPVSHASAVVLNGFIYLLGGRRNDAASDQILRFDPARGTVLSAGRLPSPVFDGAAATASGVGYLVGGIGAQGTSVDSVVKLSGNP